MVATAGVAAGDRVSAASGTTTARTAAAPACARGQRPRLMPRCAKFRPVTRALGRDRVNASWTSLRRRPGPADPWTLYRIARWRRPRAGKPGRVADMGRLDAGLPRPSRPPDRAGAWGCLHRSPGCRRRSAMLWRGGVNRIAGRGWIPGASVDQIDERAYTCAVVDGVRGSPAAVRRPRRHSLRRLHPGLVLRRVRPVLDGPRQPAARQDPRRRARPDPRGRHLDRSLLAPTGARDRLGIGAASATAPGGEGGPQRPVPLWQQPEGQGMLLPVSRFGPVERRTRQSVLGGRRCNVTLAPASDCQEIPWRR